MTDTFTIVSTITCVHCGKELGTETANYIGVETQGRHLDGTPVTRFTATVPAIRERTFTQPITPCTANADGSHRILRLVC